MSKSIEHCLHGPVKTAFGVILIDISVYCCRSQLTTHIEMSFNLLPTVDISAVDLSAVVEYNDLFANEKNAPAIKVEKIARLCRGVMKKRNWTRLCLKIQWISGSSYMDFGRWDIYDLLNPYDFCHCPIHMDLHLAESIWIQLL